MTGIERLRKLTDATLGYVRVASVTPHDYEYENDVEWDERTRLSELLASIYSQINREQDAMVADSPYEALPPEEREAIAWVREHGGLSHVKDILHDFRAVVERIGVEWSESELHGLMDALDRRLMPEGVEWMLWDDGKPVTYDDAPDDVIGVYLALDRSGYVLMTDLPDQLMSEPSERVRRPAVLAADGEPLEVGQTVWHVSNGIEFTVVGLPESSEYQAVKLRLDDGAFTGLDPDQLTHKRPVLDADGVPIKVGDMVWPKYPYEEPDRQVESAEVVYVHRLGRIDIQAKYATGMSFRQQVDAKQLTHTKPEPIDTWQRIEEDARGLDGGVDRELFTHTHEDIVRRCRALAERERGE